MITTSTHKILAKEIHIYWPSIIPHRFLLCSIVLSRSPTIACEYSKHNSTMNRLEEILYRIIFFTLTLFRTGLSPSSGTKLCKRETKQISIWSRIFKNDQWLKEVKKDHARLVLIGPQLGAIAFSNERGSCENQYMTLFLLDGTRNVPAWELFSRCLHDHAYDVLSNEIRFPSGITLNVHNLRNPYLASIHEDSELRHPPTLLVSSERMDDIVSCHEEKSFTQYSFYGSEHIQDLTLPNITKAGGDIWEIELCDRGVKSKVFIRIANVL